ncbi:MAG: polysaccharide deacetylase family protein [Desulfobacteraceae bacterium]|nr:polysaccharide deacetylase family protein [Desulfobacteraceae bacterium]
MKKKYLFYAVLAVFMLWFPAVVFNTAAAFSGHPDPGQIQAFIYHHFGMEEKYPSTSVSVKQFKAHLDYLEKNDYTVLTLGNALDLISSEDQLPEKIAVITMDDGYRSIWQHAVPILDEYGYTATVFIPTSHVGGNNYLTWRQIAELQKKGFEIGNHSHSHEYFLNHSKEKISKKFEADLEKSHELFRRHLNKTPKLYAYPFGEYNPEMIKVLKKYGYLAAAAQKSGVICTESNRFVLPRFPMNVQYGKTEGFAEKAQMNALRVVDAEPEDPVISGQNPPELTLRVQNSKIYPENLQCFVSGNRNCTVEHSGKNSEFVIKVRAGDKLSSRRTLYTVTASSREGSEWFWYSHLWIQPEYGE